MRQVLSKEVFDLLEEGVICVDRKGRILKANRFAACLCDRPVWQLFKMKLDELPPPLKDKACSLFAHAQKSRSPVFDSFYMENKGHFELVAISESGSKGVLLIRDRSDQKQVIEMGKTFITNASHELRTPITIIKGYAETLQEIPKISLEMLSEITEKIVRNCQRMENLVKGLLTLSDVETISPSRFQECAVKDLLEGCRHLLRPLYPDARVDIVVPDQVVSLRADPDILELALFNLFENAAKYSHGPAHITAAVKTSDKEIYLAISDRGIGMKGEDLEHIFERFYTVDKARSRKLGGAGIGLSIVKTVIEKHKGTISVRSKLGVGTTFTITLSKISI